MAATSKTPILLYGSTTPTNTPTAGNLTNSSDGCEIAINVADKNLFFKDSTNSVNTVPIRQSSASSNGWLSSTDWSTFNGKVSSQWTTSASTIYYNTGNVGIGTTPAFKLDVSGPTGDGIRYTGGAISTVMGCSASAVQIGSISSTDVSFLVSAAEKVRFFTSGGVSIGNTTDPGAANLSVNNNVLVGETTSSLLAANRGVIEVNGSSTSAIGFAIGGTNKSYLFNNGTDFFLNNVGTGYISVVSGANGVYLAQNASAWAAISDEKTKDIIEPIVDAVNKVSQLRSVIGKYKTDQEGVRRSFLIAQDVQSVLPEAVSVQNNENKILGLQYTDVIPLLVAAIKELTQRIETLEKTNGSN